MSFSNDDDSDGLAALFGGVTPPADPGPRRAAVPPAEPEPTGAAAPDQPAAAPQYPGLAAPEATPPASRPPEYQPPPTYQVPPSQAPAFGQPAFGQPAFEQPAYEPPAYVPPSYQPPSYDPPAYEPPVSARQSYTPPAYEPPIAPADEARAPAAPQAPPSYDAPPPSYDMPPPSYDLPPPSYEAPKPTYEAPSYVPPTYDAPTYDAPSSAPPSYDLPPPAAAPSAFSSPVTPSYDLPAPDGASYPDTAQYPGSPPPSTAFPLTQPPAAAYGQTAPPSAAPAAYDPPRDEPPRHDPPYEPPAYDPPAYVPLVPPAPSGFASPAPSNSSGDTASGIAPPPSFDTFAAPALAEPPRVETPRVEPAEQTRAEHPIVRSEPAVPARVFPAWPLLPSSQAAVETPEDLERSTVAEKLGLVLALLTGPIGLAVAIVNAVRSGRRRGWLIGVVRASLVLGVLSTIAAGIAGYTYWNIRADQIQHAETAAASAEFCAAAEADPTMVTPPTLGWPAPAASVGESIVLMQAWTDRWTALSATAPPGLRSGIELLAEKGQTIVDAVTQARAVDDAENQAQIAQAEGQAGVATWYTTYCLEP